MYSVAYLDVKRHVYRSTYLKTSDNDFNNESDIRVPEGRHYRVYTRAQSIDPSVHRLGRKSDKVAAPAVRAALKKSVFHASVLLLIMISS